MYKFHTRLNLIEGGNRFKQGDRVSLSFSALDSRGEAIDLENKNIQGEIYSSHKGVIYEKAASYDTAKQLIIFQIDRTVDYGTFQIEFTVTDPSDADYRLKIPSDPSDGRINILGSTDSMDFVGVKMTTVSQLRAEIDTKQQQFEAQVNPKVQQIETEQQRLQADYQAAAANLTQDSEVILARGNEVSLGTRLNKTAAQLSETGEEIKTGIFSRKANFAGQKSVVFLDDDGAIEVLSKLKPIADQKGFKFTMAIIPGYINDARAGFMNYTQIKGLMNEGHDVTSHSILHLPLDTLSLSDAEKELRDSKEELRKNGIYTDHFVYPGGGRNAAVDSLARKYYKSAVAISTGINSLPIDNQYRINRIYFDVNDLAYCKNFVDQLDARDNGMLVFMMHTHYTEWDDGTKEQQLRDLVDYIATKNITIKTYSEAFENFGNVIDIGNVADSRYFKVDPAGNVYSPTIEKINGEQGSMKFARNSVSHNALPSFFPTNKVSITDYNLAYTGPETMPVTKAGLLVTYKGGDVAWQYWYPYNSDAIYIRRKHTTADSWLAFKLLPQDGTGSGASIQYPKNSLTFATPPSFFMTNYVGISDFDLGSIETQFPISKAGQLVTYKGSNVATQYWYPYGSESVFIRRQNGANNTWLAFREMPKESAITVRSTQDFGSIPAHSTKDINVVVEGTLYGRDMAVVNPSGSLIAGIMWSATINTTGLVTIRLSNVTGSAITVPSTQSFRIKVLVGTVTL